MATGTKWATTISWDRYWPEKNTWSLVQNSLLQHLLQFAPFLPRIPAPGSRAQLYDNILCVFSTNRRCSIDVSFFCLQLIVGNKSNRIRASFFRTSSHKSSNMSPRSTQRHVSSPKSPPTNPSWSPIFDPLWQSTFITRPANDPWKTPEWLHIPRAEFPTAPHIVWQSFKKQ